LPPEERLRKLIATVLFAYRDADTMHKVQINELDKLAEGQQRVIRALERKLVGIVARALARLNPTLEGQGGALLKPITMSLFGILNWSYLWFRDDKPIGRDAYAQLVTRLFVDGAARLTPAAIGERAMATARRLDRP
jgi:TetR/AcrR family transcriptional regulator